MATHRVVFVQKFIPHYRLPFFERVRDQLAASNIEFIVIYGEPDPFEGSKVKMAYPSWGCRVNSRIFKVRGKFLYWQSVHKHIKKGDLVVVEQAAKMLDNYWLYALHRIGHIRFGYFGHGECFQPRFEFPISRWVKAKMVTRVTRWFAYTEVSRKSLLDQGVPDYVITVVNNTLVAPEPLDKEVTKVSGRLIYVGGLYKDKRLDLIVDGFKHALNTHPHIQLHIVGDGPLAGDARAASRACPQIIYHESLYGTARNELLASSEAILMPGLVGLVAMDSFFFNAPIITSHAGHHSPEIAYLIDGENALFDGADGNAETYGALIAKFVSNASLRQHLLNGCASSAADFSMSNMVDRFSKGVSLAFNND